MDTFPGNSHNVTDPSKKKTKPADKKVEQIISSPVIKVKKPLGQRFKNIFVGGEFKSAVMYITGDVLLPAVRNMVVDATTKGIERLIYGDSAPGRSASFNGRSRVSFNTPVSREATMLPRQAPHYPSSSRGQNHDIVLESRAEAELVLSTLLEMIDQYDFATVADFHSLVGLASHYVDNNWGWSNLSRTGIRQVREGYLIELPPTEPLN